VGVFLTSWIWNSWVPVNKPPQYSGALAMFRPLTENGAFTNGPASAKLFDVAKQDPSSPLDYWKALGSTFTVLGPAESDSLMTAAGVEAIKSNLGLTLTRTLLDMWTLLDAPGSLSIDTSDPTQSRQNVAKKLTELDIVRTETSVGFGGDFTYPTRHLVDEKMEWLETLRTTIPAMHVVIELFGGILVISILTGASAAILLRDLSWLSVPLFGLAVCFVAALSQGVVYRYIAPVVLMNVIVAVAAATAALAETRRRQAVARLERAPLPRSR